LDDFISLRSLLFKKNSLFLCVLPAVVKLSASLTIRKVGLNQIIPLALSKNYIL
jgi:hypothetical protein